VIAATSSGTAVGPGGGCGLIGPRIGAYRTAMRKLWWFALVSSAAACGEVKSTVDAPAAIDAPIDVAVAIDGPEVDAAIDAAIDAPIDAPIDAAQVCTPNAVTCAGSTLSTCNATGTAATTTTCAFGCFNANRCADLAPSNNLAARLDLATNAQPLTLTGTAIIDTSAGTVTNGGGAGIAVTSTTLPGTPVEIFAISVKSLSAANITVRGTRALAILSDGDVTITGTVSLSADGPTAGPGSITTGTSACLGGNGTDGGNDISGDGGGGFGSAGGTGGAAGVTPGGRAGAVDGSATLVPLRGGCRGGQIRNMAGGGGGAIQISARGRITVGAGAFIAANGGGGSGGLATGVFCLLGTPCWVGAGGGSGGGILLEAAALTVAPTGGLVANGGSGHMGTSPPSQASNGLLSESASPPFVAPSCTNCGAGGGGASVLRAAGNGGSVAMSEGAGGGGGFGRIRINLAAGSSFDPAPPIVSPTPTIAAVATR
jgi:hypothetical protein